MAYGLLFQHAREIILNIINLMTHPRLCPILSLCLFFTFICTIHSEEIPSTTPLQEVHVIGAPITGSLVEGYLGSIRKGTRRRFNCCSLGPKIGFLGPQKIAKHLMLKDQPGIFPAPLMGPAFLTFIFSCEYLNTYFTPIIIKPNGDIMKGSPMSSATSPQTIIIAAPAQTGIYTLFVLPHQKESQGEQIKIETSISTHPYKETFFLNFFEPSNENYSSISAEFIYTSFFSIETR